MNPSPAYQFSHHETNGLAVYTDGVEVLHPIPVAPTCIAQTPWTFLEENDEDILTSDRPLTICDADNNDLAQVFSFEDSTVAATREQAIWHAKMFKVAPEMREALQDALILLGGYGADQGECGRKIRAILVQTGGEA